MVILLQEKKPWAYISEYHRMRCSDLGKMTFVCSKCGALHWKDEQSAESTRAVKVWESCCKKGKVQIPKLQDPPQLLKDLLKGEHEKSAHFLEHLRQYNATFAFTSFGAAETTSDSGRGVSLFQVHGELYHLQGPINNDTEQAPCYAQLYIYDSDYASDKRSTRTSNSKLNPDLIKDLTAMLHYESDNPFIHIYKHAHEQLSAEHSRQTDTNEDEPFYVRVSPEMKMDLIVGKDSRTQNLPTVNEVAAIVPNEFSPRSFRDIIITYRAPQNQLQHMHKRINETHAAYMPLHYVMLFPKGDYGWNWGLRLVEVPSETSTSEKEKRLTQRAYYRYRLHQRSNEFPTLFYSKRLFQQYVVDVWAICDQTALGWIRTHQDSLRADVYQGVVDALNSTDYNLDNLGQRLILPSSYTGSPRFMAKLYQDAMAIVRHYGKPSLFITFTANPHWEEIKKASLYEGQPASDRPDLVARVFNLKVRQLLNDIKKKEIFGPYKGLVRTIEYQKRGLPHVHILLFIGHEHGDFTSVEQIDQLISAELPDRTRQPELHEVVSKMMMHGPCGIHNPNSPCMKADAMGNKVCSKNFPKQFQPLTIANNNGYPSYRRRNDGKSRIINHPMDKTQPFHMDNTWVVPYNPYLSGKYKAHINVEVCGSVQAIKYINKYIYKGPDRTTVELGQENDEIKKYLSGRYISPVEAVWRISEFPMHEEDPTVYQLPVHLPGQQAVYFKPNSTREEIQKKLANTNTMLMGYFNYYNENPTAKKHLYQDFPQHFTWCAKNRIWQIRKKIIVIGRISYCNPSAGERFYLRLLLTVIPGPKSYEFLRTVNGIIHNTFREACVALHLTQDDKEWIKCFDEAKEFSSGSALRAMFTSAILFGELSSPLTIWNKFKTFFCDDLDHRLHKNGLESRMTQYHSNSTFYEDSQSLDYGLFLIDTRLKDQGQSSSLHSIPDPIFQWSLLLAEVSEISSNAFVQAEKNYDCQAEHNLFTQKYHMLNTDQKEAFDTITGALDAEGATNTHFFLQGPAGTGKTFLYNTLCHFIRGQGKIVLCVASSGIAALLLPGGRTSHSRFKIPLEIDSNSRCSVKSNSDLANLIRQTSLIIWDEVPMQHRFCFEAVDRTLQDICNNQLLFGGIPVVLGGDFAQIAPVVRKGGRPEIVEASLLSSTIIWSKLRKLELKVNMRLSQMNESDRFFSKWIAQLSYNPQSNGMIMLPQYIKQHHSETYFINSIYPTTILNNPTDHSAFFQERAILCAKNADVESINQRIIDKVAGNTVTLYSQNTTDLTGDSQDNFPVEYLQSLAPSGLPPHRLVLKVGLPVMLLRNINPEKGLCNGTRLIIKRIGQYVLQVSVPGPDGNERLELIPRFTLSTLPSELPFVLTRKQFPIKVCFAMTINKSQGQSLKTVGVDLRSSVFTHGQLYVALSRVTSAAGLHILLDDKTHHAMNVVYPEILFRNSQ